MANAKVLEQEGEQVRPALQEEEEGKFEKSSENVECIVLQSEVPKERTCVTLKADGSETAAADLGVGCKHKRCITCSAKEDTSGYKKEVFEINN
eukprot:533966-Heterocapsa_arctica.AAC.1